jgi:Ni2+-binding GTPase involved in maturation of urease and hydrogenase
MKLVVVGGPPSVGKTSVLLHALAHLKARGRRVGAAKLDCLVAGDEEVYRKRGIEAIAGLSSYVCPDHYLATNIDRIAQWGLDERLDLLVVESAGLCNRCSPYLRGPLAIAVLDTLSGLHTPRKVGPMLKSADVALLTRGDLVSQAEREVFRLRVAAVNRRARILEVNGLTGQGAWMVADLLDAAPELDLSLHMHLRYPVPAAVCSFCLGERDAGMEHAIGNVRLIPIPPRDRPGATD